MEGRFLVLPANPSDKFGRAVSRRPFTVVVDGSISSYAYL